MIRYASHDILYEVIEYAVWKMFYKKMLAAMKEKIKHKIKEKLRKLAEKIKAKAKPLRFLEIKEREGKEEAR